MKICSKHVLPIWSTTGQERQQGKPYIYSGNSLYIPFHTQSMLYRMPSWWPAYDHHLGWIFVVLTCEELFSLSRECALASVRVCKLATGKKALSILFPQRDLLPFVDSSGGRRRRRRTRRRVRIHHCISACGEGNQTFPSVVSFRRYTGQRTY